MASRQRSGPPDGTRRPFSRWAGVAGLLLLFGSGCGGGPQNEAVSGSVTWKGQPLDQGRMEFLPADKGLSMAVLIQDGRYEIPRKPGLAPGSYQVRIFSRESPLRRGNPNAPADVELIDPKAKERIPPRYNLKTELKAEVKKGGGNTFDFDLK